MWIVADGKAITLDNLNRDLVSQPAPQNVGDDAETVVAVFKVLCASDLVPDLGLGVGLVCFPFEIVHIVWCLFLTRPVYHKAGPSQALLVRLDNCWRYDRLMV